MRRALFLLLATASVSACARTVPPPALFPLKTVWVVPGDEVVEPPLAADEARLFAAARGGSVRALDRLTGAVVWQLEGRPGLLAVAGGLLVLRQPDGTVWGLDPGTGATRWSVPTGVQGNLAPAIAGDKVLVAGEGLAALDAATGRMLWSAPGPPLATSVPVLTGPWVLVGEEDGTLRCRDAATGVSLWTYRTDSALTAPPVVDDRQRILLGTADRRVVALRLDKKGKERWRWKVGGDVPAAPAILEDKVLVAAYDDVLYGLKRSNGHMLWRAPLASRPISGPLLMGVAAVVAAQENEILGFDGRTGRRLGSLKTPAGIATPPLLLGDRLYVGLRDRSVACLELSNAPAAPEPPPAPAAPRRPKPNP